MPDNADSSDCSRKQEVVDSLTNTVGTNCHIDAVTKHENDELNCYLQQQSAFIDQMPETNFSEIAKRSLCFSFGDKLPPLATVFPQESGKSTTETELYLTNDERYSFLTANLSRFQESKTLSYKESLERGIAWEPMHAHANEPEQTIDLSSAVYQTIYGASAETTLCEKSRNILRKRQHNRFQDNSLPPNVNAAFKKLRNLIPTEPADRRLSKVETLRLAVSYIQHLGQTLSTDHWVEQPCLIDKVQIRNSNSSSLPICTFCMSKKRKICINTR